jgi:hypothetical protein
MRPLIKDKKIIRISVAIAGILLFALAAFANQASSIPSSQLINDRRTGQGPRVFCRV